MEKIKLSKKEQEALDELLSKKDGKPEIVVLKPEKRKGVATKQEVDEFLKGERKKESKKDDKEKEVSIRIDSFSKDGLCNIRFN